MRKYLLIFISILALIYYLTTNFIYHDNENNCFITIIPYFLPSNTNTIEILKIIKTADINEYKLVCQNVKTISKNISCGGLDGGCFQFDNPHKIYAGNDQGNIGVAAAIIVHETCHAIQAAERRPINESECYKKHGEFLGKITIYDKTPKQEIPNQPQLQPQPQPTVPPHTQP